MTEETKKEQGEIVEIQGKKFFLPRKYRPREERGFLKFRRKLHINYEKSQVTIYIPILISKTLGLKDPQLATIYWDGKSKWIIVEF